MTSSSTQSSPDERLRLEFNDWARAGRGESMEQGHRPIGEQALVQMEAGPTARVLDIGCGSGWASRLLATRATAGRIVGIDISDEMVAVARASSQSFPNVEFQVASAEHLPFADAAFTHAFSMESIYYYADMAAALAEVNRVLEPAGSLVVVVDLYQENQASHQWIEQLKVPVHLLSTDQYHALFEKAGFTNVRAARLYDPSPIPEQYSGSSFKTHEDYVNYRQAGSLVLRAEAGS